MADNQQERDAEIDSFVREIENDVSLVFGRFLSGISDDPRDAAWDILFLALMDAGLRRVVSGLPWNERARSVANLAPDVRANTTRGLDAARTDITGDMTERLRTIVQERIASPATRMRLSGRTSGLREAIDAAATMSDIVDVFHNAMLTWERTVLDRVAPDDPVFIYDGPVDSKNRPFCADIAPRPRAYTRRAIEDLNGHPLLHSYVPPNVFTFCGGYNCRHLWLPMTRATAEERELEIIE